MSYPEQQTNQFATSTNLPGYTANSSPEQTDNPRTRNKTKTHSLDPLPPLPRRSHRPIPLPARLDITAVHARRGPVVVVPLGSLLLFGIVDVDDVESVQVARQEGQDGKADVDEEVGAAAGHYVDAYGWDCVEGQRLA